MTKEEAKKMGATHCDDYGNYFKHNLYTHWFRLQVVDLGVFWTARIYKPDNIKPL